MISNLGAGGIILIGIGNEFRHDDGVGLAIARQLQPKLPPHITITEASGEGVGLMEMWQDAEIVYLFDAVQSGDKSGTIHRLDAQKQSIPTKFFNYSTHAFSVAEAIELARTLNQLPAQLIIYGVEGKNFTSGVGLSPEVEQAAIEVVERVYLEFRI
ncbi:MAG: hydrogenase maturation protease [Calothrix sp. MO_192.B10]|nr:hydrogenase maturation protease [Calothrix sp. MO_192.B10]